MQLDRLVQSFLSNPDGSLLTDDVELTRTRTTISGREAVLAEVTTGPAGRRWGSAPPGTK